ncbi:MAG: S-adenosylmethionine decarboxylase [Thermoplasmata archaeon]|nr:S-adenosylmethionine decarboxylase [Thermoplasmata archaeon]
MKMAVGIHIIADMYGVDPALLARVEKMKEIFEGAVNFAKLSKISSDYYQFRPEGASGIVLIAESHLSFHTWPEYGLVTLDIYTCGDPKQADLAYEYIKEKLNPSRVDLVRMERGVEFENEEANIEISEKGKEPVGIN